MEELELDDLVACNKCGCVVVLRLAETKPGDSGEFYICPCCKEILSK